ncbi:MAG: hypothetical protein WD645_06375 [Dehalococcoidia bacterium]
MTPEAAAQPAPQQPAYVVSRERLTLTLALPFLLLFAASLVAWPWRAWGLPIAGTVTPLSVVLLAAVVAGSLYAIRRKLPMGMITWVPAGQGAIAMLGTGFLPPDADPWIGLAIIIVAYSIVFLLLLGLAVAVASHGVHLAVSMVAFFVMAQATRFPIFEAEPDPITGASLLTLAAALRALVEVGVLAWLATRLVTAPPDQAKLWTWAIVGLTLAHGVLASWEDPLRLGEFTLSQVTGRMLWWSMLVAIPLGMVTVLARLKRSWSSDGPASSDDAGDGEVETAESPLVHDEPSAAIPAPAPALKGGRPTPRKHRRR